MNTRIGSSESLRRLVLLVFAIFAFFVSAAASATCTSQTYNVTSFAPPPLGNWTDISGAVWSPAGGFPGCSSGDVAQDFNGSPTTLIINSVIPNPIIGFNVTCAGCTVDIQSGGSLTLAGAGSFGSGTTIIVEPGGTLTIASGGTLTFASGSSLSVNGGIADVQSGGSLVLNGSSTVTNGGTLLIEGGNWTVNNVFTVQSTGTIELDGGSVDGTNLINNNGLIKGSGTLNVSVNNNGRIAPGGDGATGVLSHLASFSQTGDGVLDIELADASNYDQVTVDGGATLAGTLNVTFLAPSLGTSWTPLTFGSHTGEMPALLPTAPKVVYASYTSTELDLTAVLVNDLSVAMAGPPGSVVAGSAISYTVDVSNLGPGPDPTRGTTTVIDSLPSGITGASASGSGWNCGAPSSGLITCTSTAAVANGDAFPTLTVSMTAPINGGSVTNLAVVSSSDDNNNANDFGSATTTVAAQSDLAITVNGPAVGILGRSNTYTFTVTNNGPSPATGTTVGSTASSGLSFLSNSGDCATAFPCSLGALYPGQSMTIVAEYVVIDPPPDATATLAGSVASGVADPNTANNSSSVNTLADGIFIDGFERSLE